MSYSVGIIGLPNVGKSTLFRALTRKAVAIAPHPFTTIEPSRGIIKVPDERLAALAKLIRPSKITPAVIDFVDIAGLVKGAAEGKGLGNQFLAEIRNVDLACVVLRAFDNPAVGGGEASPAEQAAVIVKELRMKDLEVLERRKQALSGKSASGDKAARQEHKAILRLIDFLKKADPPAPGVLVKKMAAADAQFPIFGELLVLKPRLYLLNGSQAKPSAFRPADGSVIALDARTELDLTELNPQEQKELELPPTRLDAFIRACYDASGLITFFTVKGGQELRAWTMTGGATVLRAAELIHSDLARNFIRAEVTNWRTLVKEEDWVKARQEGLIRTEGKEYVVKEGDVVEIKV